MDGHVVSGEHAGVVADSGAPGRAQAEDASGARQEALVGVFGVDPALDGMAPLREVFLAEGQGLSLGDADLELHEVLARDHLRDRVLDLEPRVHLEEVGGAVRVHQELEGPRVDVAGAAHEGHGEVAHALRGAPG